jgi:hypothetical protein
MLDVVGCCCCSNIDEEGVGGEPTTLLLFCAKSGTYGEMKALSLDAKIAPRGGDYRAGLFFIIGLFREVRFISLSTSLILLL